MRKFFKKCASLLALSTALLFGANTAMADPVDITFGESYTVTAMQAWEGSFFIMDPTTVTVVISAELDGQMYQGETEVDWDSNGYGDPKTFEYNLQMGMYTYKIAFPWSDGTVKFETGSSDEEATPLTVPATNFALTAKTYSYTPDENGTLTIKFSESPYDNLLYLNGGNVPTVAIEPAEPPYTDYSWAVTAGNDYILDCQYVYQNGLTADITFEAAGGNGGGGDQNDRLELPVNDDATITLLYGENKQWYYTPTEDGVLTVTVENGLMPLGNYLFTEAGVAVPFASTQKGDAYDPDGYFKTGNWNLTANTTYYFKDASGDDGKICKFTFGNGDEEDPDQPGEPGEPGEPDVDGYSPMTFDETISVPNNSVIARYFTPETDGVLTITQTGAGDPYLWTVPSKNDEDYSHKVEPANVNGTSPYVYTYNLTADVTVYYYAEHNSAAYKDLSSVLFEWMPKEVKVETIQVDTPTEIVAHTLYEFTAPESGVLSVTTVGYPNGLATRPNSQNFLFTDKSHTTLAQALAVGDAADDAGYLVTFDVEAGDTYYLYYDATSLDSDAKFTCTFSISDEVVVPKLASVDPAAGSAIDLDAQESTFSVLFEPANITVESVDFTYLDEDGATQTVKNIQYEFGGGALQIPFPQFFDTEGTRLSDVSANAVYNLVKGAEMHYIINKVTYNGTPVTESDVTTGVEVSADGTIDITYMKGTPITLVSDPVLPNPFLQYWPATAENAKAVFTFTGSIGKVETLNITEGRVVPGSVSGGDDPAATVNISSDFYDINDNVLTINFAGLDMTSIPAGNATLCISVFGTNGLLANMVGTDPRGVFYFTMTAAEIDGVICTGFDPAYGEELEINEDHTATFTVNFSGPAKVTGAVCPVGVNSYNAVYAPVKAGEEYCESWTITMPADYIELMAMEDGLNIGCNITAVDEDGNAIGYGSNQNMIVVTYAPVSDIKPGVAFDVTVAKIAAKLDSFKVSAPEGYSYISANDATVDFYNPYTSIEIKGDDNDYVGHAVADGFDNGVVTFSPAITESGSYTITFPYNAFNLAISSTGETGEGDVTKPSQAMEYAFEVTIDENGDVTYMDAFCELLEPASMMTSMLQAAMVTWEQQEISVVEGATATLYINKDFSDYESKGNLISQNLQLMVTNIPVEGGNEPGIMALAEGDVETGDALFVIIPEDVEGETGVYNIVIPAGSVMNADGEVNQEVNVQVYVLPTFPVENVTVEPKFEQDGNVTVASLETIEITFEDAVMVQPNGEAGVEIRFGDKVFNMDNYDEDWTVDYETNVVTFTIDATPGEYEFVVPDDSFMIVTMDENDNQVSYFNSYLYCTYKVTGSSQAVYSATFDITAAESFDMSKLIVYESKEGNDIAEGIKDGKLDVLYVQDEQFTFAVPEEYEILITAPMDLEEDVDYVMIANDNLNGYNTAAIGLRAGADKATFQVIISTSEVLYPETYVTSFVFNMPEGFEDLMVSSNDDLEEDLTADMKDNTITVYYGEEDVPYGLTIGVPEGYEIFINVPDEDDVPATAYKIYEAVIKGGVYSIGIDLYEGADKAVFGVIITEAGVKPEPDMYSTTFNFVVPEGFDLDEIKVYKQTDPEELISDGIFNESLTVFYEDDDTPVGFLFAVPEDYQIEVTAPEALTAGVDYLIGEGVISSNLYTVNVDLNAGADKAVFTVTIVDPEDSGIAALVGAKDGKYVVYNVNGVMVLSTENAAEINNLENGLYIVNGKKVLVRK